jgi:hypothetical protein
MATYGDHAHDASPTPPTRTTLSHCTILCNILLRMMLYACICRGQEIHALDGVFRAAEEAAKAKQAQARGGLDLETFAGRYKLWLKGGEQGVAAEPSKILAAFQALDSDGNKK